MANRHFLGIDYGERRIGLALGSDEARVARPWKVIEVGHTPLIDVFKHLVQEKTITDIVLGLPRNLDGDDTDQTRAVRRFGQELDRLGLPVHLQDEAVTSELARQRYPDEEAIDAAAAAIILQDFLEDH